MARKNIDGREKCEWCIRAVKWLPVLLIMSIIAWSYYAYVYQLCIVAITSQTQQIILLATYHIILTLFLWTYCKTMCTSIGEIPNEFQMSDSEYDRLLHATSEEMENTILEMLAKDLPVINLTLNGAVRQCGKCQSLKPDRAHHCSICGYCVLKMDHHCPWINNCVSFTNYKYFLLFLGYALAYCICISAASAEYFIDFWKGELEGIGKFHIVSLFFVSLMFVVSLVSLFGYHCYLVLHNRTTLEAFRPPNFPTGPDKEGFDLGACNNLREVFGTNPCKWFIPVWSSLGDGITYPIHPRHWPNSYNTMDSAMPTLN